MMDKFEFLIGSWILTYNIPKSSFSEAMTATARGVFQRIQNDKYVSFDYEGEMEGQKGGAHGIFGWDEQNKIYRYWWFESSGAHDTASCQFLDDDTLYMNWHNSVLRQTFKRVNENEVILHMEQPGTEGTYELILEVVLSRES